MKLIADQRVLRWTVALVTSLFVACAGNDKQPEPTLEPGGVLLAAPPAGEPLVDRMVERAVADLTALTGDAPVVERMAPGKLAAVAAKAEVHRAGLVVVLDAQELASDLLAAEQVAALGESDFALQQRDQGDWPNKLGSRGATFLLAAGRTRLARQYALYESLRRLGARYFHPEQPFLPKNGRMQLRDRARQPTAVARLGQDGRPVDVYKPDFLYRSWSFHGAHPLEHLEAFSDGDHPIAEAERVEDWIVANRGNLFKGMGRGVSSPAARQKRAEELEELRALLGFPRGAGIGLHNQQQGASAEVDPSLPTPVQQQIEDHVASDLKSVPDAYEYSIHFGPTEFTVTPDKETVQWLNWAGLKALELQPNLTVSINDHTTGSQPTPNFSDLGCPNGTNSNGQGDYYDLAFHTDKRLGVQVHTVMFYPLEGPAYVYNQTSFAHKLCLMQKASAEGRPLTWFPEGSWWLSFDNPIPVYLPLYIWTRGRDVELLKPLLAARGTGTLRGHRMFNSGQEWGYWQQDYAVGLWHWNADVTLDQVLAEVFDPLCSADAWQQGCAARAEAVSVLKESMARQKAWFLDAKDWRGRPGGLYAYFSGEDPADEIAAVTGFEFRPVRPSFQLVASWNAEKLAAFVQGDLAALAAMQAEYAGWLARLQALQTSVPDHGKPWLAEVIDGMEINYLRAKQGVELYTAVVRYREDHLAAAQNPNPDVAAMLAAATQTLAAAQAVISRREQHYRYPAAQMYGGGVTPETAVPNGTTYPWRVHTKTHLLTYWTNRNELARQVIEGNSQEATGLVARPGIAAPGVALGLTWPKLAGLTAKVQMGNGSAVDHTATSYSYGPGEGIWSLSGEISADGATLPVQGAVARAALRATTPKKGLVLQTPSAPIAQEVLGQLFPALRWAHVPGDPGSLAFAADPDGDGDVDARDVVVAQLQSNGPDGFVTQNVSFSLPVPDPATGLVALQIRCSGVSLSGSFSGGKVKMTGALSVEDLVLALIDLAGFEKTGALQTLGGVLGFDWQNPPATVPFAGTLSVTPEP